MLLLLVVENNSLRTTGADAITKRRACWQMYSLIVQLEIFCAQNMYEAVVSLCHAWVRVTCSVTYRKIHAEEKKHLFFSYS